MKKASSRHEDDLRAECDFSSMKGGVRGKYYRRFQAGTNIVRLEPDLARVFPTDEAVNEALRTVVRAGGHAEAGAGRTREARPLRVRWPHG